MPFRSLVLSFFPQDMKRLNDRAQDAAGLFQMLGVVKNGSFTELGRRITCLPEVGGVRWRCVLAHAAAAGIGKALLMFCAGMKSLPNIKDPILERIPVFCLDADFPGDISSLYLLFSEAYKKIEVDDMEMKLKGPKAAYHLLNFVRDYCQGNAKIYRILQKFGGTFKKFYEQIEQRIESLEKRLDDKSSDDPAMDADHIRFLKTVISSSKGRASVQDVCKVVMRGFVDRVAISEILTGGRSGNYMLLYKHRYSSDKKKVEQGTATIQKSSKVARKPQDSESAVFAVELSHLSLSESTPKMLSLANKIEESWLEDVWLPPCSIYLCIHDTEEPKLKSGGFVLGQSSLAVELVQCERFNHSQVPKKCKVCKLTGPPLQIVRALKHLHESNDFVDEYKAFLQPPKKMEDSIDVERYRQNVQLYRDNVRIFNQWINHWKNNRQVSIQFKFQLSASDSHHVQCSNNLQAKDVPFFNCKSRQLYRREVEQAVEAAGLFLAKCAGKSAFHMKHEELQARAR